LFVAALLAGCGHETVTELRTITSHDVQAGSILRVDSRSEKGGVFFDQRPAAIDFDQIELVCPSGQAMPMSSWLDRQAEDIGVDLFGSRQGFSIISSTLVVTPPQGGEGPSCARECHRCPDGLLLCGYHCRGWSSSTVLVRTEDQLPTWIPPQRNPGSGGDPRNGGDPPSSDPSSGDQSGQSSGAPPQGGGGVPQGGGSSDPSGGF
jgi:hypothetical protein